MKRLLIALATAILAVSQLFLPVAAAASPSAAASTDCGTTYTVQHADNLSKIAVLCNTTVADILSRNPQISNPNIIYTGQVIRISGSTVTKVYSSTYTVKSGDTLSSIALSLGTTVYEIKLANTYLLNGGTIYTGLVLNIPSSSSSSSYSGTTYTYSGNARVTISRTQASSGDTVDVYVRGFPKNMTIDYRVGQSGEKYSVAYDGTTDEYGEDSKTITIPSSADKGEYWVVLVTTTGMRYGVEVTSSRIYINN